MWALATSASAQPQLVGDMLYHSAVQRLEELEAKADARQLIDIMQVQAWLLLTFYEFMRVDFRRGWMSAGRAFRLIQLMKLHELDLFDMSLTTPPSDWVDVEERRRTFWLAYSVDRFVSLSNGSPLTLSEQVISDLLSRPNVREAGLTTYRQPSACQLHMEISNVDSQSSRTSYRKSCLPKTPALKTALPSSSL